MLLWYWMWLYRGDELWQDCNELPRRWLGYMTLHLSDVAGVSFLCLDAADGVFYSVLHRRTFVHAVLLWAVFRCGKWQLVCIHVVRDISATSSLTYSFIEFRGHRKHFFCNAVKCHLLRYFNGSRFYICNKYFINNRLNSFRFWNVFCIVNIFCKIL
jgi:hypothetical protein